jgi:pimeloyl-ACP methyl ester carboxylesterase
MLAALLFAAGSAAQAQVDPHLNGDWTGVLALRGASLRVVFHIQVHDGLATATLDSPDQHRSDISVASVEQKADLLLMDIPAIHAKYSGRFVPGTSRIEGRLTQLGADHPLSLSSGLPSEFAQPSQDQEPTALLPYRAEEVSFISLPAKLKLAGTLTLPKGAGPFSAVVLIKGSGPLDRDETISGHKPFLVLADALTRNGLAVLRVDGRGVGGSERGPASATSADLVDDVAAAVAFLRQRADIRADRIGLIGHSEGGVIAPMVAAADARIAFVVMLAGLGVDGKENTLAQMRAIYSAQGEPPEEIERRLAVMTRVLTLVENAASVKAVQPEVVQLFVASGFSEQRAQTLALRWDNEWEHFFLSYRPETALARLHCPVLALNGSKDLQVLARLNLPALKAALSKDADATVTELPGLNHLFQSADTGLPSEYGRIEETIDPHALDTITNWVLARSQ